MSYVAAFSRSLIFLIFLAAVLGKLRDRRRFGEFVASVAALRLVPASLVGPVAVAVAGAEVAVCALLLALPVPGLTAGGLGLAAALLTGFSAAIATALSRGVTASCRCFGGDLSAPFGRRHVVRNATLALVGVAGAGAVLWQPATDLPALAITAPFALLAAALTVRLDDVVEVFRPLSVPGR
ncbi:MauE/DoxX family redox-associated membrane protein [Micromonospora sp. NPDC049044]|uniref:MauE/DoxX family redox-associated membrane protein n=1 Tax=unclassified Micromonospora TaxID=2617518 RepID=UPI003400E260